jgi:16S rRNA (cytidine1402-2'-O)-methyltransferase
VSDDPREHDPDAGGAAPARGPIEPALHLVATPIGAARDITLRALDVLGGADLLLAEDTRNLRRLLEIHGVRLAGRPLWAYHDHNGAAVRPKVLEWLGQGRSVALVSDAGTPLVADPGFPLVRAAVAAGYRVRAAPGASALLAALSVAALPTDRFAFLGFPPTGGTGRARIVAEALALQMTTVLYESPRRIHRLLEDLVQSGGGERPAALCRELTKRFEEVRRGTVAEILAGLAGQEPRGEIVLVLGAAPDAEPSGDDLDAALVAALAGDSLRAAVDLVAQRLGLPRRVVYQRALALQAAPEGGGT